MTICSVLLVNQLVEFTFNSIQYGIILVQTVLWCSIKCFAKVNKAIALNIKTFDGKKSVLSNG